MLIGTDPLKFTDAFLPAVGTAAAFGRRGLSLYAPTLHVARSMALPGSEHTSPQRQLHAGCSLEADLGAAGEAHRAQLRKTVSWLQIEAGHVLTGSRSLKKTKGNMMSKQRALCLWE